jgi:hypothetical protein
MHFVGHVADGTRVTSTFGPVLVSFVLK